MLRPEKIYFSRDGYPGTILMNEDLGALSQFEIQAGEKLLQLDCFNSKEVTELKEGDSVKISYDERDVVLLEES